MTSRLYYTDAYLTRFSAAVTERADEGRRIYLERTAFYPTSGGQPHDLGVLGGVPVVEVREDDDGRIAHLLGAALPASADAVEGMVDWSRRWDHMQQHTGQHLVSALFADLFDCPTVSVHFGAESSTVDLGTERVTSEMLLDVERRANEVVAENRPVSVTFEEAAEATGLRKPSTRSGELRVVAIEGIDRSACGGTHVRRTGEIGAVLLRRMERVRAATRVEFLCGARAVARARADHEALARAAQLLSAAPHRVPEMVQTLGEQARERDAYVRRLEAELAQRRARALYDEVAPDANGVRRAIGAAPSRVLGDAAGVDALRSLAHAFTALPRTVFAAVTTPKAGAPATLFVAASEDSGADAGALLRPALAAVGGRGGGNPRIAQGSIPDPARIAEALDAIERGP